MIKGLDNGYMYTKDKVVSGAIPIIIDGKQYYTGIGKTTVEIDKINSDINKVCTLTNLAMSNINSNTKEIYLVVGLPISQYKTQKDKFKETILNYNHWIVEYQNRVIHFNINDVMVFPQGVTSLHTIDNLSSNELILDIGGRTFDISLIEMIDNKPTLIKSDT